MTSSHTYVTFGYCNMYMYNFKSDNAYANVTPSISTKLVFEHMTLEITGMKNNVQQGCFFSNTLADCVNKEQGGRWRQKQKQKQKNNKAYHLITVSS